ncbi:BTB protein [Geosmithia morbida]|uniref:BTB protein n=1 Tax=Geosmithia morbida TaxID=1094350 RepID=A0A9P4YVS8_9HYPO|nr:BTB protein [Geosmithia morbida]KAF4122694.1 BTB protein [Geosmithia morbida]
MSHLLWKYYWDQDVDRFRHLLASPTAGQSTQYPPIGGVGGSNSYLARSPGAVAPGTSPRSTTKSRRPSGFTSAKPGGGGGAAGTLGKAEVNSRDHAGLTILLRTASSTGPHARDFAQALIDHPAIDLYAQDAESGWNALHRALYAGNVSIARMLLHKERENLVSHHTAASTRVGRLIKTKDNEGNSPFDLYNSTIATRSLDRHQASAKSDSDGSESGDSTGDLAEQAPANRHDLLQVPVQGDELYVFGSNKNLSLGVGDGDDRQFPERIQLRRPDSLIRKLYEDHCADNGLDPPEPDMDLDSMPTLVRNAPIVIKDVVMSKLHSAILTTDPASNLYVSGVGRGGRLGLGNENTQFRYVPVQGPLADKRIQQVALGQNHTLAIAGNGELWTWGLNTDSQLGYVLPPPTRPDEEPMCVTPRQVFGSMKKDVVLGIAASSVHSVAHTGSSLYCWGRNNGQLALMDSDSRSLDVQQTPRKVAASLLSAPIEMVSAADRATSCLLSNHTVWVFTNYGYNLVKFPIPDVFANYSMAAASYSNRYEPDRKKIGYITSGGSTIAAVTARGDLFTMHINQQQKDDAGGQQSNAMSSTTNPVKIKGALTQPQCIWDSRKDAVVSVNVGEHGSVIICTESGAAWKRVKRSKGKNTGFSADVKQKDFKFERVPYITNCVATRSSTFGAFAAVRADSKVMSQQIKLRDRTIWEDMASLLCLKDFRGTPPVFEGAKVGDEERDSKQRDSWETAVSRERQGSVAYEVLRSADVEADLLQLLRAISFRYRDADVHLRTSSAPDLRIPVHSFLLAGRSSALRSAFVEFREHGALADPEHMAIEPGGDNGKTTVTLANADILTVLNIVVFVYQDYMIPVWKYTREALPGKAHRFRQVRIELMRWATRLGLPKLEAAARLQIGQVERSMDKDLQQASKDPAYLDGGDVVIELDGNEVTAHCQLLCQRCPFFQGIFQGRSDGQWLAERRSGLDRGERVRVDLGHIRPETFDYVILFLYGDVGPEVFDDVVSSDGLDDFAELVLDVMFAANELMLDRLSQICQLVIGRFVTTRNISNMLNEISACHVTDFKDTGLEYICLQLETMLENHCLEDLDEDLLHELDGVVRDNQLARLPIARSGRADLILRQKYPDLPADVDEEHRVRVRELAYKASQREDDRKLSSSYRARVGSLDDWMAASPTADKSRRKSKAGYNGNNGSFSPMLRPKNSTADLVFAMDDDPSPLAGSAPASPELSAAVDSLNLDWETTTPLPKSWLQQASKSDGRAPRSPDSLGGEGSPLANNANDDNRTDKPQGWLGGSGNPWASAAPLQMSKLDLRNIMSETSSKSNLSARLAGAAKNAAAASSSSSVGGAGKQASLLSQARMSQKERKRQRQLQAEAEAAEQEKKTQAVPWEKVPGEGRRGNSGAWAASSSASAAPKVSLQQAMASDSAAAAAAAAQKSKKPLVAPVSPSSRVRAASPDTRFPGQGRVNSGGSSSPASGPTTKSAAAATAAAATPITPHSKSYITRTDRMNEMDTIGASMADIIGHQKREQQLAREAVAKRSLQEIQQEQEFQQWWDQESRRAQEEEEARRNNNNNNNNNNNHHNTHNAKTWKRPRKLQQQRKPQQQKDGSADGSSSSKPSQRGRRGGGGGGGERADDDSAPSTPRGRGRGSYRGKGTRGEGQSSKA